MSAEDCTHGSVTVPFVGCRQGMLWQLHQRGWGYRTWAPSHCCFCLAHMLPWTLGPWPPLGLGALCGSVLVVLQQDLCPLSTSHGKSRAQCMCQWLQSYASSSPTAALLYSKGSAYTFTTRANMLHHGPQTGMNPVRTCFQAPMAT